MAARSAQGVVLFNPVSIVHYRNIKLFDGHIGGYRTRCVLNPKFPWFSKRDKSDYEVSYMAGGRALPGVFDGVKAMVVFSAQPRAASCHLIQEAALRSIPVIAIEEVYQMMLEQGYVNEYFLPVDHLFAGSGYEREKFVDFGIPAESVEVTGCIFDYPPTHTDRIALRERLGLAGNNRVATLSLAYQTPSGETLEVRRKLLEIVSESLPEGYDLVVKPHPAEQDEDIASYVKRFAPRAKVADKFSPIGDILSITDVLLNRGNSQVIINALQRKVPVIAIPMGRKIFLEGLLDRVVVKDADGLKKAFAAVSAEGFDLYEPVFARYLNITASEALKTALSRIKDIADNKKVLRREPRLFEIALFWAWMGYVSQAKDLLKKIYCMDGARGLPLDDIGRLISFKADDETIRRLIAWSGPGYRGWVVRSLWIKAKYMTMSGFSREEKESLGDFPPRANREYFIPAAVMLCWCYLRAGMRDEFKSIFGKVSDEYWYLKEVEALDKMAGSSSPAFGKLGYWKTRAAFEKGLFLRNLAWRIGA